MMVFVLSGRGIASGLELEAQPGSYELQLG